MGERQLLAVEYDVVDPAARRPDPIYHLERMSVHRHHCPHSVQYAGHHGIDAEGAGDLYAAGVLFGLTRALPLPTCGTIGSLCAAEIISHVGARPAAALDKLVASAGLVPQG